MTEATTAAQVEDVSEAETLAIIFGLIDGDNAAAPEVLDEIIRSHHLDQLTHELSEQDKDASAAQSPVGNAVIRSRTITTLGKLGDVAERAIVLEAVEAEKTGWHHFVPLNEYASVREMLNDLLGEEKSTSVISDITFLASVVVPYAENHAIEGVRSLIGRDKNITAKARAIVPRLRMAMADEGGEKTEAVVRECLTMVADKNISEAAIRASSPDSNKRIAKFEVTEFISEGDDTLLLLRLTKRQLAYVRNRLNDKAIWTLGDRWPRSVTNALSGE